MTLTITISQDIMGEKVYDSHQIILDDMKHSPELEVLGVIADLKKSVMKRCNEIITETINKNI